MPETEAFGRAPTKRSIAYDNATMARYLAQLAFKLELGAAREKLAKWRTPVSVGLDWPGWQAYRADIETFLALLRRQTQIAIDLADNGRSADIVVRIAPSIEMRRLLGSSFCITVPEHTTWNDFATKFQAGSQAKWAELVDLRQATIFIPDTAQPYLVRACLAEEIMQALGPAGDFYYLAQSSFNDDQMHLWPTAFDLLVLRVLYDDRLRAGMTRDEVERQARAILDDIHAAGRTAASRVALVSDTAWETRFQRAQFMHHPKFATDYYVDAMAQTGSMPAHDPRRLLTRFEAARNLLRYSPSEAQTQLKVIAQGYRALLGEGSVHEALVRLEALHVDLWFKRFAPAGKTAESLIKTFVAYGREDKVAEALLIRDAARDGRQRPALLANSPSDSRAWADYAFGRRVPVSDSSPPEPEPTDYSVLIAVLILGSILGVGYWRWRQT